MSSPSLNPEPSSQDLNRRVSQTLVAEFGDRIRETPAFQALCQAIIQRIRRLKMKKSS